MRDYGKVHTSFWSSNTIQGLSEDARTLAFYLLTCPHGTIAGVFRIPDGYVCEDMQWAKERVLNAFTELSEKRFAKRCEVTKWVWICKHFEWNGLENPNQIKSAKKIALSIPDECAWKRAFMLETTKILDFMEGEIPLEPFHNPFETVSEPFPNHVKTHLETLSKPVTVAVAVTVTEKNKHSCSTELSEGSEKKLTQTEKLDEQTVEASAEVTGRAKTPAQGVSKSRLGDSFALFWANYPKRVSKGQARRAWEKLNPTEQLQGQILASLELAKTSDQWAKDNGRFIPHPATWLNAEGWEDEITQAKNGLKSWLQNKLREEEGPTSEHG